MREKREKRREKREVVTCDERKRTLRATCSGWVDVVCVVYEPPSQLEVSAKVDQKISKNSEKRKFIIEHCLQKLNLK